MKRLALIVMLGLVPGLATATFELQDPAAQVLEEQQEPDYGETGRPMGENSFCVFVVDDDQCFCVHKETKDRILLTDDKCVEVAIEPEIIEEE
jgi:hypothetical protein